MANGEGMTRQGEERSREDRGKIVHVKNHGALRDLQKALSMYNEKKAIAEIRGLSTNAKNHLQHVWRNSLQIMASGAETRQTDIVTEEVVRISNELRRLGL